MITLDPHNISNALIITFIQLTLSGLIMNYISIVIYSIWYYFITKDTIKTTEGKELEKKYSKESTYQLFSIIRLAIPFLGFFKVYEYIITYGAINDKCSVFEWNVFEKLIKTELILK